MTAPPIAALRDSRLARAALARWTGWGNAHVRRVVLIGFGGSALLALGSLGAGAPPVYDPVKRTPVIAVLRDGVGERAALALVYVGLAVLGMAWLYLGRSLRRGEEGTDTSRLLKIAALWGAPLVVCVPLFSRDLYAYAAQAQIAHAGLDPYSVGPVSLPGPFLDEISGMWVDTPAPYGPLWLGLGRALATVTGDRVVTTVLALRLLAVAGVLLTAKYLPRLARAAGGDPRVAVWLGIANPLVLVHFVAGGHNDALMVGLLVAGLTIAIEATEERWVAVGVVVCSAAVLVKAPAAVAVAFLAWAWAKHLTGRAVLLRACVRTGVVALVTIAVLTGVTGLGFGWIDQLNASGQVVAWTSIPTGIGMLIETVRHVPNFVTYQDPVIAGFRLGGQVATALVLLWLWLRSGRAGWVRAAGLALLVVVVLGPVVQPWYVLWGLSLLAATRLDRRTCLIAAGVCFWLSMMITPQGSNMFLEVAPVIATAVAAAVATLAVLGRSPDEADDADEPDLPGDASREPVNTLVVAPPAVNGRDLEEPVASVP